MKSPIRSALEVVVGLLITTGGTYMAAKIGTKLNGKANADIRASAAQERIATSLEAIAKALTFYEYDSSHGRLAPHVRRKITKQEDEKIMRTPGCAEEAYVGYDDRIHPDYCR